MGCAFDSFSTSWGDRSYVITLMVFCWALPTANNIGGYIIMIKKLSSSDIKLHFHQQTLQQPCSRAHKFGKRVNKTVNQI